MKVATKVAMKLSTTVAVALAVTAALPSAGCGNYSNEDLEFMSVLPVREDVAVEVPRRGSLVVTGPEGWLTTLRVTHDLNAAADAFLGLIDTVRGYYPTTRRTNERIWGPFPADQNPGWQVQMVMTKMPGPPVMFLYVLEMIAPPEAGLANPLPIISGSFDAAGGLRLGDGTLTVTLDDARAAGVELRGLEQLRTLNIRYQVETALRHVELDIVQLPQSLDPNAPTMASYTFERAENGDSAMTFSFPNDVIPGGALETLAFTTRWLGSGQGRTDITVTGGEAPAGAGSTECWNDNYILTYKLQSWLPAAELGDPSTCISPL